MNGCTCKPYHVIGCPAYGEDNRIAGHLVTPSPCSPTSTKNCPDGFYRGCDFMGCEGWVEFRRTRIWPGCPNKPLQPPAEPVKMDVMTTNTNTVHVAQCANCGEPISRTAGRFQRAWRHTATGGQVCELTRSVPHAGPKVGTEDDTLTDADLIDHLRIRAKAEQDGILVCEDGVWLRAFDTEAEAQAWIDREISGGVIPEVSNSIRIRLSR